MLLFDVRQIFRYSAAEIHEAGSIGVDGRLIEEHVLCIFLGWPTPRARMEVQRKNGAVEKVPEDLRRTSSPLLFPRETFHPRCVRRESIWKGKNGPGERLCFFLRFHSHCTPVFGLKSIYFNEAESVVAWPVF